MKTKCFNEAADAVHEIMNLFREDAKKEVKCFYLIQNVSLKDMAILYKILPTSKQLYMPKEIDNENMTITFVPVINCIITIESEPCVDFRWKIKHTEFNWN